MKAVLGYREEHGSNSWLAEMKKLKELGSLADVWLSCH